MDRKSVPDVAQQLVIKSLLLFTILQITQIRSSQSISTSNSSPQKRPPQAPLEPLLDLMVMDPDTLYGTGGGSVRKRRSATQVASVNQASKFVDACQSKVEVITPYHATNSKGKVRTIVNSELMQQAIQVETCLRPTQSTSGHSNRCNAQAGCGCEQKYKWHRLLALDPHEEPGASRGLFMDWFLFPSNCVCRCKPTTSAKQFLRTISGTRTNNQPD